MKFVYNSKEYNTETATEIASYSNNYDYDNLFWRREKLYKTKDGEYFIYGKGGPCSIFQNWTCLGDPIPGERIYPLRPNKEKAYIKNHWDEEAYIKIFGESE